MNQQSHSGGIPSRITGLALAVIHHLCGLFSLASVELRCFLHQGIRTLILLCILLLIALIAYLTLITSSISLLAIFFHWGWTLSLAFAGFVHLALVFFLYKKLKASIAIKPFEVTKTELHRDLHAIIHYANCNR